MENAVTIWKHRDQVPKETSLVYQEDGKYSYTALTYSFNGRKATILGGINQAGFGIMTTTTRSYVARPETFDDTVDTTPIYPGYQGYGLSAIALRECRTVDEYEELLRNTHRSRTFQSNVGVGDAQGGAAYFEIWSDGYKRYDVNNTPKGFDVRTNFSFTGVKKKWGKSVRRYDLLMDKMSKHEGKFTVEDFWEYSRSYVRKDGSDDLKRSGYVVDENYTVPRKTSLATIIIICSDEPKMLISNGHPVSGMLVPIWVKQKDNFPKCMQPFSDMFRLSREFTEKAYYRRTLSSKNKVTCLNKEVISAVRAVNPPVIPWKDVPADFNQYNVYVDNLWNGRAVKLRRILSKFD